jgi:hypothetical protein
MHRYQNRTGKNAYEKFAVAECSFIQNPELVEVKTMTVIEERKGRELSK